MIRKTLLLVLCVAASLCPARSASMNAAILRALETMPAAGGYSANSAAARALGESITLGVRGLSIDASHAVPSYCSGATYLVFLQACAQLVAEGELQLDPATLRALLITGQRDGEGIWGRWNANGPGTARLFHELGLGRNFLDWDDARPGDFMKIFWSTEIGQRERGHSVIFLGAERGADGIEYVRFWSSNQPTGFGEKRVDRRKIPFAIFSRLEQPANLARIAAIAPRDAYLASLLSVRSSPSEARLKCGITTGLSTR